MQKTSLANTRRTQGDTNWVEPELIDIFPKTMSIMDILGNKIYPLFNENWVIDTETKEYVKVVKLIEQLARGSFELKNYIKYLKESLDLNKCHFIPIANINNSSIELHHHPFTMYDITSIIFQKSIYDCIENKKEISLMDILSEIVEVHYNGLVGLIPLSKTVHEATHNGDLIIPISWCHGNIKGFLNVYSDVVSPYLKEKIRQLIEYEEQHIEMVKKKNANILNFNILKNKWCN